MIPAAATRAARVIGWLALGGLGGACHRDPSASLRRHGDTRSTCPAERPGPPLPPGTAPEHELAEFWLARYPAPIDGALLGTPARLAHNARIAQLEDHGWPVGRWDVQQRAVDHRQLAAEQQRKLQRLERSLKRGSLVAAEGVSPPQLLHELRGTLAHAVALDQLRVVRASTALRCLPTAARVVEPGWLPDFDLLQCSQLRFGEPVRVLARAGRQALVWSSYATGWAELAALSPALTPLQAERYLRPPRWAVVASDDAPVWSQPAGSPRQGGALLGLARLGLRLPLADDGAPRAPAPPPSAPQPTLESVVVVPTAEGLGRGWIATAALAPEPQALTVRQLFARAFALLHQPYGWGGTGHRRDCSRLLMDLFASFGIDLPRSSAQQAAAGVERLAVAGWPDTLKAQAIARSAQRGVVLLYLPGHVMLYVGQLGAQLYALHSLSGYLAPCQGGGETMWRLNRTAITTLALGERSSRRSFLARITRLMIFSPPELGPDPPGPMRPPPALPTPEPPHAPADPRRS
ncbi:MAG: C40 family peptidase [Proteobacteria bacterium]|nr:C40 family peptidase [Pseudomonadota bacterium]